jgi:small basic protein (TIGR04137 family)
MSIHRSLKTGGGLVRARSVYTRAERLALLKKLGKWSPGDPIFGIPKTRVERIVKKAKGKKKEEAAAEGAPGAAPAAAGEKGAPAAAQAPASSAAAAKKAPEPKKK